MNPTNDIRDIKGLVPIATGLWWLWLLIALIGIGAVAWLIYRRLRRKEEAGVETAPVYTPYDLAVRALRCLLEEKLMEGGLIEEFYVRLSDIVRQYLEGRFHLRAPDLTTEEFLLVVSRNRSLTQEHKDLLGAFLQECDLVKFARFQPATVDMQRAFDAAERFVNDTRPRLRDEADAPVVIPPELISK